MSKVRRVEHHAALPYGEVSAFLMALGAREGVAALALRFLILTATRTSEALGARWDEIDLNVAIWMIPASRMKAGREHRIPLSDEAMALLKDLPRVGDYVFPGQRLRDHSAIWPCCRRCAAWSGVTLLPTVSEARSGTGRLSARTILANYRGFASAYYRIKSGSRLFEVGFDREASCSYG